MFVISSLVFSSSGVTERLFIQFGVQFKNNMPFNFLRHIINCLDEADPSLPFSIVFITSTVDYTWDAGHGPFYLIPIISYFLRSSQHGVYAHLRKTKVKI